MRTRAGGAPWIPSEVKGFGSGFSLNSMPPKVDRRTSALHQQHQVLRAYQSSWLVEVRSCWLFLLLSKMNLTEIMEKKMETIGMIGDYRT